MKWLVIGISGPTCSGKTSLAKKLHDNIQDSILMSQDTYFLSEDNPKHSFISELNHFNWEILSSLDMSKMYSDIINIIQSAPDAYSVDLNRKFRCFIIEGFLIYNYKPIAQLCKQKYFIEISKETCSNRRKTRVYNPPDVPEYFNKIVWPEYLKHKSEIILDTNLYKTITFLDGNKSLNELYDVIKHEIE
ncbi:PREDICTED: nicotinamide riboside kinase 1, partial [Ceratosolen solmsi marchali]|uniref:Nicotinamide riboside kinase 1 n=1 Tax=Ceratosolen solmsi marchali TaxID=326594 RepID=A0AAJ7DWS0_9HYME